MNKLNKILLFISVFLLTVPATFSFAELIGQSNGRVVTNIFTVIAFLINLYLAIAMK